MSMSTFLKLKVKGNEIKGPNEEEYRDGTIECASFDFGINAATAGGGGAPTADRDYDPIRITKRIDIATPLILDACARNKVVDEAIFSLYRPSGTDVEEDSLYMVVTITKARIAAVDLNSPHSNFDNPSSGSMPMESVTFVYDDITLLMKPGNEEFTDNRKERI